ncbi:hypothetical protein DIPPA_34121 [Diplonema papillatum]|nr:hypothetical protein DIPPA_34121 [Diplonema papillatum]
MALGLRHLRCAHADRTKGLARVAACDVDAEQAPEVPPAEYRVPCPDEETKTACGIHRAAARRTRLPGLRAKGVKCGLTAAAGEDPGSAGYVVSVRELGAWVARRKADALAAEEADGRAELSGRAEALFRGCRCRYAVGTLVLQKKLAGEVLRRSEAAQWALILRAHPLEQRAAGLSSHAARRLSVRYFRCWTASIRQAQVPQKHAVAAFDSRLSSDSAFTVRPQEVALPLPLSQAAQLLRETRHRRSSVVAAPGEEPRVWALKASLLVMEEAETASGIVREEADRFESTVAAPLAAAVERMYETEGIEALTRRTAAGEAAGRSAIEAAFKSDRVALHRRESLAFASVVERVHRAVQLLAVTHARIRAKCFRLIARNVSARRMLRKSQALHLAARFSDFLLYRRYCKSWSRRRLVARSNASARLADGLVLCRFYASWAAFRAATAFSARRRLAAAAVGSRAGAALARRYFAALARRPRRRRAAAGLLEKNGGPLLRAGLAAFRAQRARAWRRRDPVGKVGRLREKLAGGLYGRWYWALAVFQMRKKALRGHIRSRYRVFALWHHRRAKAEGLRTANSTRHAALCFCRWRKHAVLKRKLRTCDNLRQHASLALAQDAFAAWHGFSRARLVARRHASVVRYLLERGDISIYRRVWAKLLLPVLDRIIALPIARMEAQATRTLRHRYFRTWLAFCFEFLSQFTMSTILDD